MFMLCSKCGYQNPTNSQFCKRCGMDFSANLQQQQQQIMETAQSLFSNLKGLGRTFDLD